MERPTWKYEVPPAGADAAGLEDYQVETPGGEMVGKVKVTLAQGDDLLLAVEGGIPPVVRDVRAVRWEDVAEIDHDSLTVLLREGALERAVTLDPSKAVEGEDAEATRVTSVPEGPTTASGVGPVDRPSYLVALVLGLLGAFSALGLVTVGSGTELGPLWALAVIPAALFAAAGIFAYRFFRRPSERL
jgi:hypothetical protein